MTSTQIITSSIAILTLPGLILATLSDPALIPPKKSWSYKPDLHCAVVIPSPMFDRVPTPMLVPCKSWDGNKCIVDVPAGWLLSSGGEFFPTVRCE